jgi:hypothetical protein
MNSRERRVDTRVNVKVPLRFRVLNNSGITRPEQTAEPINISERGILFPAAVALKWWARLSRYRLKCRVN